MTLDILKMKQLRDSGLTYTKIGEIMGVSKQKARVSILGIKYRDWTGAQESSRHQQHKNRPQSYSNRKPCKYCDREKEHINA